MQFWRGPRESKPPREVNIQAESQVGKLQGGGQGRYYRQSSFRS